MRKNVFVLKTVTFDASTTGLKGWTNTVIFRNDLPPVYGLANMPEAGAAKYTDTIEQFERRRLDH